MRVQSKSKAGTGYGFQVCPLRVYTLPWLKATPHTHLVIIHGRNCTVVLYEYMYI